MPIFGVCRKPRRLLTSGVYRRLSLILQTFAITNALPFPACNDRRGHAEASGSLLPDGKAQLARDLDAVPDGPGDRAAGRVNVDYAFYGLVVLLVGDEVKNGGQVRGRKNNQNLSAPPRLRSVTSYGRYVPSQVSLSPAQSAGYILLDEHGPKA